MGGKRQGYNRIRTKANFEFHPQQQDISTIGIKVNDLDSFCILEELRGIISRYKDGRRGYFLLELYERREMRPEAKPDRKSRKRRESVNSP